MNNPCTAAQQRVIDALIAITGLSEPSFAPLDEGPRLTITYGDCIHILEEDGTVSDSKALLARAPQEREHTLLEVIDLDDRLNREERCPTGDEYNAVIEIVRGTLRHCPLITFDANAQDIARRLIESIEGCDSTVNGSIAQLDAVNDTEIIVRDWTQRMSVLGAPRVILWADVKTIHVH